LKTGNCELKTQCTVKEIRFDKRGRAQGVSYFDKTGKLQELKADGIVVAGAAIETARLLLNSRHRLHANGLGNRYGQVGRQLQGHVYTTAVGILEQEVYDDLGPGASIAVADFNHGNDGIAGGGVMTNDFLRLPVRYLSVLPPDTPKWGIGHKRAVRDLFRRTIVVTSCGQEIPTPEQRVEVDAKVRDRWGIPVARISGLRHPHSIEVGEYMSRKAEEWLKAAGAVKTWRLTAKRHSVAGFHQAGTCRMGNDPRNSVVDANCRLHGEPNVYVADGSVHVTNGGFNPVLTIMALAYRTSEHIVREWKGTRLRG
jgi:choline dehydrogenase-like flavoprotein